MQIIFFQRFQIQFPLQSYKYPLSVFRKIHNQASFMILKITVGPKDHRYLKQDGIILVALFNQKMGQQNQSS